MDFGYAAAYGIIAITILNQTFSRFMDFGFCQLVISIVAVMLDFAVIFLFFDQVAQRVVAVTGALVLGKAVAADSTSVGKVVSWIVAVVLVCALDNSAQCVIGVIPAAVGLVIGTDEVTNSVVLVTAADIDVILSDPAIKLSLKNVTSSSGSRNAMMYSKGK